MMAMILADLAYLEFALVSVVLAATDVVHRRLPDRLVLPATGTIGLTLLFASSARADWAAAGRALAAAVALFGFYLLLSLLAPRGIGGGDVKLAPLTGLVLGYLGWGPLVLGAWLAFALAAPTALTLFAAGRIARTAQVAFGPFMLLGAWTSIGWAWIAGEARLP